MLSRCSPAGTRAYSYRHTERFLSAVARAGGAETLTDALAERTARLSRRGLRPAEEFHAAYYIDGHRKAMHSDKLIPRGLVSRYGKVLGCRALMLLHDEHGHPLLALTHRGDTHLTVGLPQLLECHEAASGQRFVRRVIVYREGMAAEFLGGLAKSGCDVVTVLRSNQYKGLGSFTEVGEFVPLSCDKHGNLTREVVSARYSLSLLDRFHARLDLRVALVRDLRRMALRSEPRDGPSSLREDYSNSPSCIDGDWVATPSPSVSTEPPLVPIVTTAREFDPVELARIYIHR